MAKIIVAQRFPTPEGSFYPTEFRVLFSTHPRFVAGSRFDWGFSHSAMEDGYSLTLLPLEERTK